MTGISYLPYDIETHEQIGRDWLEYELSTRNEVLNFNKAANANDLEKYLKRIIDFDKIDSVTNQLKEVKAKLQTFEPKSSSGKKAELEQKKQQLKAQLDLEIAKAKRILQKPGIQKKIAIYQNLVVGLDHASNSNYSVLNRFADEGMNEVAKATMQDSQAAISKAQLLLKQINEEDDEKDSKGKEKDKIDGKSGDENKDTKAKKDINEKDGTKKEDTNKTVAGQNQPGQRNFIDDIVYAGSI